MRLHSGRQLEAELVPTASTRHVEPRRPQPAQSTGRTSAAVDNDLCTACGFCVDVCPEQAISVDDVATIESGRCTGCGACVVECPTAALSLGRQTPAMSEALTE